MGEEHKDDQIYHSYAYEKTADQTDMIENANNKYENNK